jgi:hypothetical protein
MGARASGGQLNLANKPSENIRINRKYKHKLFSNENKKYTENRLKEGSEVG